MKCRIYKILFKPRYWNLMCQIMMRRLYYNAELCTYGVIGIITYKEALEVTNVKDTASNFDLIEIESDLKNKIIEDIRKAVEEAVIEEIAEELEETENGLTLPIGTVKRTKRWGWKRTRP